MSVVKSFNVKFEEPATVWAIPIHNLTMKNPYVAYAIDDVGFVIPIAYQVIEEEGILLDMGFTPVAGTAFIYYEEKV